MAPKKISTLSIKFINHKQMKTLIYWVLMLRLMIWLMFGQFTILTSTDTHGGSMTLSNNLDQTSF